MKKSRKYSKFLYSHHAYLRITSFLSYILQVVPLLSVLNKDILVFYPCGFSTHVLKRGALSYITTIMLYTINSYFLICLIPGPYSELSSCSKNIYLWIVCLNQDLR